MLMGSPEVATYDESKLVRANTKAFRFEPGINSGSTILVDAEPVTNGPIFRDRYIRG